MPSSKMSRRSFFFLRGAALVQELTLALPLSYLLVSSFWLRGARGAIALSQLRNNC
ncbi:hypothetical protein [aff. Roholtiella sp. LEGE 12411]|uniref:hypothetical protein n=1 Tax=aff. Roholtiella sp. LEGE 12411 TaxID=1828822 RepID=UPI00187E1C78|nr:hypothetical protein [aff. Roholtiella sp. LEGE 12411]MBE9037336.1 hypothetical protein [aff. Roholtiella sp. LEGE 12411]